MSSAPPRGRVLAPGRYLTFVDDAGWEYVTRHGVTGIVVLVAITPAREIVLVEQYRAPVGKRVIELPAGIVGDVPGHERESLPSRRTASSLEETGFEASEMVELVARADRRGRVRRDGDVLRRRAASGASARAAATTPRTSTCTSCRSRRSRRSSPRSAPRGCAVDPKIFAGLYLVGETRPA